MRDRPRGADHTTAMRCRTDRSGETVWRLGAERPARWEAAGRSAGAALAPANAGSIPARGWWWRAFFRSRGDSADTAAGRPDEPGGTHRSRTGRLMGLEPGEALCRQRPVAGPGSAGRTTSDAIRAPTKLKGSVRHVDRVDSGCFRYLARLGETR